MRMEDNIIIFLWLNGPKDVGHFPLIKMVPEGYYRYFFGVKVQTVKLIGGRRFLAARSGLNAIYACPNHTNDGIHSDHG